MLILRPMTMEDADWMLEWKNYPETRKFAIASSDKIKRENHIAWLQNNVQYFQIAEYDGITLGAIRIQDNEISIWVDRALWGKGFATNILELVSTPGMQAKIVAGNISSMRAFIKSGYLPIEYIEGNKPYYIFQKK